MIQLLPYQEIYLKDMPKNIIMTADLGLGKTIMSIEHYRRHNAGGRLLVVAPASKVRTGDWPSELSRFFDDNQPEYEVISYEAMTKRANEFIDPNLTIIADECHFVCNATSKRAKAFLKIARAAKQWIGLSFTAVPNGWRSAETYAILTGLVPNKTSFVNRFVIIDRSRGFPLLLGYREQPTLERWWATIAKPLQRTGALQLPSQNIGETVPMSPRLQRTYTKAVKERFITHPDGEIELLDNPSKLFTTLRQLPNPARIDALQSIVESTDEGIVVFYNFNSERDAILAMLAKNFKERTIYEQSGHASNLPRREEWATLPGSVTLVQYQSGSQAIELTYASVTVYLSPCTSYANYEQSKGRTRRNGQEKTTLFYHIAVEGSLDHHIWGILKQKKDFSTAMINKLLMGIDYTQQLEYNGGRDE